ncbi:MAG: hypothetical protein JWM81_74 [Candidatus Saccharibacteria bacterium]|nr:hypothetical protein [Candidatus Saccharibacteria bacterium]
MDYLDPKKRLQHTIILYIGYVLIGIAILIGTIVLVYQAYGFGVDKNGTVIQNGIVFFSSQPSSANIYINGKLNKSKTNTRLSLPSNIYNVELQRTGYDSWKRTINVEGGKILSFDYPLLIPSKLTTTKLATYDSAPSLATQSPDRRWIVVAKAGSLAEFDVYDTRDIAKAPVTISLPAGILTAATTSQSLELSEWSADNSHLILKHHYDTKTEYILLDREQPEQSQNLTQAIGTPFSELTLIDRKYDQYYVYDSTGQTLSKATLKEPTPKPYLTKVLAYHSYSDNTVLYATPSVSDKGLVAIKVLDGDTTYNIRTEPAGTTYLLDLTKFENKLYVVAGASSDNRVFIYKDPLGQVNATTNKAATPLQVLRVKQANYISFSSNTQYVMVENGNEFAVYDIKVGSGYNYVTKPSLDAPQLHASWMDGNRITYVSGSKQVIFDYDNSNAHSLTASGPAYSSFFTRQYNVMLTLAPADKAGAYDLLQTPLLTPADR